LDILKDRLYTGRKDGNARRSSQTVFYHLLNSLTSMMAPILTFLSEETYGFIPGTNKKESVFLTDFPKPNTEWVEAGLLEKFETLATVREELARSLEELRQTKAIGSSLDAKAVIQAKGERFKVLTEMKDSLREYFIVSAVELSEGEPKALGAKADGEKCERCWHYSTSIGADPAFSGVCPKCVSALK
jgi:isoleucyl-tRNA synthetase